MTSRAVLLARFAALSAASRSKFARPKTAANPGNGTSPRSSTADQPDVSGRPAADDRSDTGGRHDIGAQSGAGSERDAIGERDMGGRSAGGGRETVSQSDWGGRHGAGGRSGAFGRHDGGERATGGELAAVGQGGAAGVGRRDRAGRWRRLVRWVRSGRWSMLLAGGAPVVLIFPDPNLEFLAWFALVPGLIMIVTAASLHEAWVRTWWFGCGYLIAALYWMAPEIGPGVPLLGAVFGGLWVPFGVAAWKLLRPPVTWPHALAGLVVVPSCWLVVELIRSWQALGGPWNVYGASQWQHPAILALASVGGVWLVSFALIAANVALTLIVLSAYPALASRALPASRASASRALPASRASASRALPASRAAASRASAASRAAAPRASAASPALAASRASAPRASAASAPYRSAPYRPRWPQTIAFTAVFVAIVCSGPLAFALTSPFPGVRQVTIAMVQPGVINNPDLRTHASETLTADLSQGGTLGGARPDLILWGESSIANDLNLDHALLSQIEALSVKDGAEILVNQDTHAPGKGHEKWSVLVSPSGIKGTYVKTRLVPFGEYIPFRQQLGWLTKISNAAGSNMVPGDGAHLLRATDRAGRPLPIGVLICFESAFPDMSRVDTDNGAQLIVYQSETSTFQGTWGPDQHGSLAAVRAAETGRPVVQAALTGDTVAFDARGRQIAWMGQSGHGVVTVRLNLPAASAQTIYDQWGDYVLWTSLAVVVLSALLMLARSRGLFGSRAGAGDGHAAEYPAGQSVPR